jgi:hypothetical protein
LRCPEFGESEEGGFDDVKESEEVGKVADDIQAEILASWFHKPRREPSREQLHQGLRSWACSDMNPLFSKLKNGRKSERFSSLR